MADGYMIYRNVFVRTCSTPSGMSYYFVNSAENKLFYLCSMLLIGIYSEIKAYHSVSPTPVLTSSFVVEFVES